MQLDTVAAVSNKNHRIKNIKRLPEIADMFPAHVFGPGPFIGHDTLGSGENRYPHTVQYRSDVLASQVDAPAGFADALKAAKDVFLARSILQINPEYALLAVFYEFEIPNEAFGLHYFRQLCLEVRTGNVNTVESGSRSVPDACQHVCNRITHRHGFFLRVYGREYSINFVLQLKPAEACTFMTALFFDPSSKTAFGHCDQTGNTFLSILPAGLDDPGKFSMGSKITETDPAQSELSHVGPRSSADRTAIVGPHFELGLSYGFNF